MEKTLTYCQGNHEAAGRDPGRRWHRSPVFPCSSSCAPSIGGCHFYFFDFSFLWPSGVLQCLPLETGLPTQVLNPVQWSPLRQGFNWLHRKHRKAFKAWLCFQKHPSQCFCVYLLKICGYHDLSKKQLLLTIISILRVSYIHSINFRITFQRNTLPCHYIQELFNMHNS